ncbi:glycosyltransferase family 39 protein [Thermogladius sp.]|uniref:glycosyltransferase family 39 protein n=1 Tax=Thermogladius sp. TaxID=2023064 RepID=UPI003D0D9CB6
MPRLRLYELALLAVILALSAAQFYYWDARFTDNELAVGGKGYVSDEVWYVASARNIMLKVFHLSPREVGGYGYTIIYNSTLDRARVESLAKEYGVTLRLDYSKLNGFYAHSTNLTALNEFLDAVKRVVGVGDVIPGWMMPDASGINTYLNLEHPPLGKYVIGLTMVLVGDHPLYWRLGNMVAGVLLIFLTFLATRRLLQGNTVAGLAAAALLSVDPLVRSLSSIALLDVYVSLFTALSFYLALGKRYGLALLAAVIGALFKFNALFALIPLSLLYARERVKKRFNLLDFTATLLGFYIVSGLAFLATQILASLPLISYLGFTNWFKQSITGAIAWHTQVKCSGNGCPVSSAPWDWFAGVNPFTLYYFPGGAAVVAVGFWPVWSFALVSTLVLLPGYLKGKTAFAKSSCWLLGLLAGYVLLWAVGGRTQYSFYAVQFAPVVYTSAIVIVATFNSSNVLQVLRSWRDFLTEAERAVGRLLLLQ